MGISFGKSILWCFVPTHPSIRVFLIHKKTPKGTGVDGWLFGG